MLPRNIMRRVACIMGLKLEFNNDTYPDSITVISPRSCAKFILNPNKNTQNYLWTNSDKNKRWAKASSISHSYGTRLSCQDKHKSKKHTYIYIYIYSEKVRACTRRAPTKKTPANRKMLCRFAASGHDPLSASCQVATMQQAVNPKGARM